MKLTSHNYKKFTTDLEKLQSMILNKLGSLNQIKLIIVLTITKQIKVKT